MDLFIEYVNGCIEKSYSFSTTNRTEFALLIKNLLTKLNMIKLTQTTAAMNSNNEKRTKTFIKETIIPIEETLTLAQLTLNTKVPIDKGWGKDFSANFYLGYEGTSVESLEKKGNSRTEIMLYNQFTGPLKYSDTCGFHMFGSVVFTNSAEQTGQDSSDDVEIRGAVEVETALFGPFPTSQQSVGTLAIGPIISYQYRIVDKNDTTSDTNSDKSMFGVRLAHSTESYLDLLWGKTGGIEGSRWEIRGQYPVARILNGRIFIGGLINKGDGVGVKYTDTIKAWIVWNVTFADIFSVE